MGYNAKPTHINRHLLIGFTRVCIRQTWLLMLFWWILILPAWISRCTWFLSFAEDEVKDKTPKKKPLRETSRASRLERKKQEKDKEEDESKEEDSCSQENEASSRKNYQGKTSGGKKAGEDRSRQRGKRAPTKDQKESENKEKKANKKGKEGENKQKKDRKNR